MKSGFKILFDNVKNIIYSINELFNKIYPKPISEKERSKAISKNFFLHFHSSKINSYSLKLFFTLGLGVIVFSLFFILIVTNPECDSNREENYKNRQKSLMVE